MALEQYLANPLAKRSSYAGNFQAMGQSGVNKVIFGQRVNLGFVLEPSKRMGKNDAVIVLLEGTAGILGCRRLLTDSGRGEKESPVHVLCREYLTVRNKFDNFKSNHVNTCYF